VFIAIVVLRCKGAQECEAKPDAGDQSKEND
jgi:hypothetical protein